MTEELGHDWIEAEPILSTLILPLLHSWKSWLIGTSLGGSRITYHWFGSRQQEATSSLKLDLKPVTDKMMCAMV